MASYYCATHHLLPDLYLPDLQVKHRLLRLQIELARDWKLERSARQDPNHDFE